LAQRTGTKPTRSSLSPIDGVGGSGELGDPLLDSMFGDLGLD
jgi:hypothetical protein